MKIYLINLQLNTTEEFLIAATAKDKEQLKNVLRDWDYTWYKSEQDYGLLDTILDSAKVLKLDDSEDTEGEVLISLFT